MRRVALKTSEISSGCAARILNVRGPRVPRVEVSAAMLKSSQPALRLRAGGGVDTTP